MRAVSEATAMTTIEDVMNYAREAGNMERRMCIGKAQGFDVRNAYNDLRAAIEQYAAAAVLAERERCVNIIETYQVPVGNSRSGELAAMWTDCKGSALSISKRVDAAVDAARGKNTT